MLTHSYFSQSPKIQQFFYKISYAQLYWIFRKILQFIARFNMTLTNRKKYVSEHLESGFKKITEGEKFSNLYWEFWFPRCKLHDRLKRQKNWGKFLNTVLRPKLGEETNQTFLDVSKICSIRYLLFISNQWFWRVIIYTEWCMVHYYQWGILGKADWRGS